MSCAHEEMTAKVNEKGNMGSREVVCNNIIWILVSNNVKEDICL